MPPIMNNKPSSFLGKTLAATMQKASKAAPQALDTKNAVSSPKDAFFAGLDSAFTQANNKVSGAKQAVANAMAAGAGYAYLSLVSAKLSLAPLPTMLGKSTVVRGMSSPFINTGASVANASHIAADAVCSGAKLFCACVVHLSASLKGIVVGLAAKMFGPKTSFVAPQFGGSAVSSTESLASSMSDAYDEGTEIGSPTSPATKLLSLTESLATGQVSSVAEYFEIIDRNVAYVIDKHLVSRQASPVITEQGSPLLSSSAASFAEASNA